jgi:hypothetical protein
MSQQINLYNPLFLRKEKHFSTRTMLQSLGLIVLGLAVIYAFAWFQTRGLEQLADDYGRQLTAQRDQFVALGSQGSSKLLEAEAARLENGVKSRRSVLATMHGGGAGTAEGFSRYFAAFARHSVNGVWLTGFSVGESGNLLRIRGRVLNPDLVPTYLKALNEDEVMRGRLVTELKLAARDETDARRGSAAPGDGPSQLVEFELSASLRMNETGAAAGKGGKP